MTYAFIYKAYKKSFVQVLGSASDSNLANQLFRSNNRLTNRTMAMLVGNSILLVGVFVAWSGFRLELISTVTPKSILFGVLGVALFVLLRFTIFQFIGAISQKQHLFDHAVHHFWIILSFVGLFMFFITSLSVFGPKEMQKIFSWVGLIAITLAYIFFVFKGATIFVREKGVGALNLIYYLCALEIMPVLLAYRTILN